MKIGHFRAQDFDHSFYGLGFGKSGLCYHLGWGESLGYVTVWVVESPGYQVILHSDICYSLGSVQKY